MWNQKPLTEGKNLSQGPFWYLSQFDKYITLTLLKSEPSSDQNYKNSKLYKWHKVQKMILHRNTSNTCEQDLMLIIHPIKVHAVILDLHIVLNVIGNVQKVKPWSNPSLRFSTENLTILRVGTRWGFKFSNHLTLSTKLMVSEQGTINLLFQKDYVCLSIFK